MGRVCQGIRPGQVLIEVEGETGVKLDRFLRELARAHVAGAILGSSVYRVKSPHRLGKGDFASKAAIRNGGGASLMRRISELARIAFGGIVRSEEPAVVWVSVYQSVSIAGLG